MKRGATIQFGGSPWGRAALLEDRDRAVELATRATGMGVSVSILGKTERGPWVVRIGTGRILRFAGRELHDTIEFGLDRWAAGADDTGIRWAAGPDGLGHAHVKRSPWTLCKVSAIGEQFVHPERARCQACWRALDRRPAAQGAA